MWSNLWENNWAPPFWFSNNRSHFSSTWSYLHVCFTPFPSLKLMSKGTFFSIQIPTAMEQQMNLLITWRRNCGSGVNHCWAEAPGVQEDKFLRTQFSVLHGSFKQGYCACQVFWMHVLHSGFTQCTLTLRASQNRDHGTIPAQKGMYNVWIRRRLFPLSWLHRSGKPQGKVGEEMQSTLSFQKHRTAWITHQAPPKNPKNFWELWAKAMNSSI